MDKNNKTINLTSEKAFILLLDNAKKININYSERQQTE